MPDPTVLKIGSVSLDMPSFNWVLLPGSAPFSFNIDCWPTAHGDMVGLGLGPHNITILCPQGRSGKEELTVRQVYLRENRPVDEVSSSWRISDRRMWLDYAKFTGRFNLRRKVNDREGLDPQALYGFSIEGYRPYSAFFAKDGNGSVSGQPWTAMGLIRAILQECDPGGVDGATFEKVKDNAVPVESKTYIGERPVVILPDLLRLAEVSMYVSLDGRYRLFDRNVPTENTVAYSLAGHTRGKFDRQNNKRTRPSAIHVYFIEEREETAVFEEEAMLAADTVFTAEAAKNEYEKIAKLAGLKIQQNLGTPAAAERGGAGGAGGDSGQAAIPQAAQGIQIAGNPFAAPAAQPAPKGAQGAPQAALAGALARAVAANQRVPVRGQPIQLENVIQLPRSISVPIPGAGTLDFTAGEWVRVDLALAAWALLDLAAGARPLKLLTLPNIQQFWFGNVIERLYCFDKTFPTWTNPEREERVNAVREHYRRTFRIGKPWLDNMHAWNPSRVTIVDPVTRTRALPFVSAQYCNVPNLRPAIGAQKEARVMAENVDDYATDKASPFVFTMVESDLGILQVEAMADRTSVIRERIRGQVDNIPKYDLNPDGSLLWQTARLQSNFKLKMAITVVWGAPNNKQVLYPVKRDVAAQGGQAGVLETISTIDTARIDKDGKVVNAGLLNSIADYETRQIMFSHRDVVLGYKHFGGFRSNLAPEGFSRGVSFVVEDGVAYTMADFTEPYSNRPPAAAMDLKTREFALRIAQVR